MRKAFLGSSFLIVTAALALGLQGCAPSAAQLKKVMEENPDIVTNVIEKHPDKFMMALQNASQAAERVAEERKLEEAFKNPLAPKVDDARGLMGNPAAPITIVEYTDFQCPYCAQGYDNLEQVQKTYGDKVRVLVKNLPLPMHPMAMPAAQYFEALRLQDVKKANAFYHEVFPNQAALNKDKEKFLDATVTKVGGNLAQVKKDAKSPKVQEAIKADMAEAESFEIQGTPGFVVSGVPIRGAYPLPFFQKIIDRRLAEKK